VGVDSLQSRNNWFAAMKKYHGIDLTIKDGRVVLVDEDARS
jgi:hypothetical protein